MSMNKIINKEDTNDQLSLVADETHTEDNDDMNERDNSPYRPSSLVRNRPHPHHSIHHLLRHHIHNRCHSWQPKRTIYQ
jgi:hypothetical protein